MRNPNSSLRDFRRIHMRRGAVYLVVAFALLCSRASAQETTGDTRADGATSLVSPTLTAGHWAVHAANRAEALGLTDDYFPAQRAVPLLVVARALEQAAVRAPERNSAIAEVAAGWASRLRAEFPGIDDVLNADGNRRGFTWLGGRASAGYAQRAGGAAPGTPLHGPTPIPDRRGLIGSAGAAFTLGSYAAAALEPSSGPDGGGIRGQLVAGVGNFMLSAGRGAVGYGFGRGGVVLASAADLVHAEVSTVEPLRLPGVLKYLGGVSGSVFLGRLHASQLPGDPYLGGMSIGFQPHPRLMLAAHRAAMFGGDSAITPVSAVDVLKLASMLYNGEENQVFSLSARYRLPTESAIPLVAHVEWGADDSAGGLDEAPGYVIGLFTPAVPGAPQLAAGVERSWFGYHPTPDRPVWYWYQNRPIPGPWAAGSVPLGHALGGNGSEWLGYLEGGFLQSRLRTRASVALRDRTEGNLYGPDRLGASTRFAGAVSFRMLRRAELSVTAFRDAADAWAEHGMEIQISAFSP